MATYALTRGQIAAHNKTLVANTADTITWSAEVEEADVITDGTADVYVSTDGTAATPQGANCYRLPPASNPVSRTISVNGTKLSIVSAAAVVYSVERASP